MHTKYVALLSEGSKSKGVTFSKSISFSWDELMFYRLRVGYLITNVRGGVCGPEVTRFKPLFARNGVRSLSNAYVRSVKAIFLI